MTTLDLVRGRLATQHMIGRALSHPSDVVKWLGAVQAQDYSGALWGIGLRTRAATAADVERAIADRVIVRSWPMRGTLHFVPAGDLRWMLVHFATGVLRRAARRYADLGLDEAAFCKSQAELERSLPGQQLTRAEIFAVLERAGVSTTGQRGIHILGNLAMRGVLCFGSRRGKQPTFTLLDEWLPPSPVLDRDDALDRLARTYFRGHGPATVHDFAWWSGLPVGEAKKALDLARQELREHVVDGHPYFAGRDRPTIPRVRGRLGHLLPPWDEYAVAYRERGTILDHAHAERAKNGIFSPVVILDGRVVGTWTRESKKEATAITVKLFDAGPRTVKPLLGAVIERYGQFWSTRASLSSVTVAGK